MRLQTCSQMWFDPILREFALSHPGVQLRHRTHLEGFEETSDGVRCEIVDLKTGLREQIVADYLVGCDGATSEIRGQKWLDVAGNGLVHRLVLDAYRQGKTIGALCYAVAALAFTRDPDNDLQSVIRGHHVTAHPHAWDFVEDLSYDVVRATPDNPRLQLTTSGFVFPLEYLVRDAVGPDGSVAADPATSREHPSVIHDAPFVTGLSVESAQAFGAKLVEVLATEKAMAHA